MDQKSGQMPLPTNIYTTQSNVYVTGPIQAPNEQLSWIEKNSKNKPQSNSAGVGALIFLIAGMNTAWAVGFRSITFFIVNTNIICAFFIGSIIGVVVGGALCNIIKRQHIILFASALTFIDGIILLSASRNHDAVMAAKYMDGIATGLVFAPTFVLVGEEGVKYMRGLLASSVESMCFYLGAMLQIIYGTTWTLATSQNFNVLQSQGVMNVTLGLCGVIIGYLLYVESPVYYLTRGQEEMAIDSLRRLQRPFIITQETYQILNEHKAYVAENKQMSYTESFIRGLPAMFVLVIFRTVTAMSLCTATYTAFVWAVNGSGLNIAAMGTIYALLLYCGAIIACFMMDNCGRRNITIFGAIMCGGMALGIAIIFDSFAHWYSKSSMTTALCLLLIYAFFSGFYTVSSSVYLSEAFPLAAKPVHISLTFIVQMVVQIIVACCFGYAVSAFYYSLMGFSFGLAVLAWFALPETKGTTLLEAQHKFNYFRLR